MDGLAETVEKVLSSDGGVNLDEGGESELMPTVAIIAALCQHCRSSPPRPEIVKSRRERYLAV
jgi:hypothetical protein